MRNSTIKQKIGRCLQCLDRGDESCKPLIGGRCQFHYKQYRAGVSKTKKQVKKPTVKKQSDKKLDMWFVQQRVECTDNCMNCGQPTLKYHPTMWKFSLAHVIEKGIFDSVKTHKDNILFLCNLCHTEYDRDIQTASMMIVFPKAVQQFNKFRHEIKEKHSKLDLFIYYADKLNTK